MTLPAVNLNIQGMSNAQWLAFATAQIAAIGSTIFDEIGMYHLAKLLPELKTLPDNSFQGKVKNLLSQLGPNFEVSLCADQYSLKVTYTPPT